MSSCDAESAQQLQGKLAQYTMPEISQGVVDTSPESEDLLAEEPKQV